jgi:hypothetical protein
MRNILGRSFHSQFLFCCAILAFHIGRAQEMPPCADQVQDLEDNVLPHVAKSNLTCIRDSAVCFPDFLPLITEYRQACTDMDGTVYSVRAHFLCDDINGGDAASTTRILRSYINVFVCIPNTCQYSPEPYLGIYYKKIVNDLDGYCDMWKNCQVSRIDSFDAPFSGSPSLRSTLTSIFLFGAMFCLL